MIVRGFKAFGRFFRQITTGRDNQSADVVRVLGIVFAIQFVWLAAVKWAAFDPVAFATAVGLMLAALATAMRVARPLEPTNEPDQPS